MQEVQDLRSLGSRQRPRLRPSRSARRPRRRRRAAVGPRVRRAWPAQRPARGGDPDHWRQDMTAWSTAAISGSGARPGPGWPGRRCRWRACQAARRVPPGPRSPWPGGRAGRAAGRFLRPGGRSRGPAGRPAADPAGCPHRLRPARPCPAACATPKSARCTAPPGAAAHPCRPCRAARTRPGSAACRRPGSYAVGGCARDLGVGRLGHAISVRPHLRGGHRRHVLWCPCLALQLTDFYQFTDSPEIDREGYGCIQPGG
jgi:hypothetical protein